MRNMSFMLTVSAIEDGTKKVTRRLGWKHLKPGDLVNPVFKCMGLKAGEKVESLRGPVRVVSVRREPLIAIHQEEDACRLEGLPELTPDTFIDLFCKANTCKPWCVVTRIEFEYTDPTPEGAQEERAE